MPGFIGPLLQILPTTFTFTDAFWAFAGAALVKILDFVGSKFLTTADKRLDNESQFQEQMLQTIKQQNDELRAMRDDLQLAMKTNMELVNVNEDLRKEVEALKLVNLQLAEKVNRLERILKTAHERGLLREMGENIG